MHIPENKIPTILFHNQIAPTKVRRSDASREQARNFTNFTFNSETIITSRPTYSQQHMHISTREYVTNTWNWTKNNYQNVKLTWEITKLITVFGTQNIFNFSHKKASNYKIIYIAQINKHLNSLSTNNNPNQEITIQHR